MKSSFNADGEVLLVTGGAQGIGAALALAYAEAGGTSVVLDVVDPSALAPDLTAHPRIEAHRVDVSDRDAMLAVVDDVIARHGRVDALVAGAAIQPRSDVADTDPAEWRRVIAVNLDGVVWCAQAVIPQMKHQRSGAIVVFASGLAHFGRAQASAYAATKGALIPFTKSLAAELADDRIRVNMIFPGVIDTAQFREANPSGGEREHWLKTTGIGTAEDVVGPLLFLLSDAATMTGSTLTRDRVFPKE